MNNKITNNKIKNVLILGNGYISKYLAPYLNKYGHLVTVLSKSQYPYQDPIEFEKYLKHRNNTDIVINCSGFTGAPNVDGCENHKDACYFYNVTAPLYITNVCNTLGVPIIHIGSGCVYSGYDKIYTEDDISDFGADCYFSSTYSKSKDTFEKLSSNMDRYIFRIRIPFNGIKEPKNYLYKLLHYDNLISKQNSITCVDDLVFFINKFITLQKKPKFGIYNVVNKGSTDAAEVVDMLKENNLFNPKWNFVSINQADFSVARSNCILSTKKIKDLGMELPDVRESLKKAIDQYSSDPLSF
jgi:dTDP-4-dehydrorhamnose reductase